MGNQLTMIDALSITVSSMTIVFLTLLVISVILGSFKNIFKEKPKVDVKKEVAQTVVEDDEEERIVVALAASIMAGNGKVNPNLHIKSIKRVK
ncbi:OadG family protein [Clostridium sp. CCUG 7971]|uniref:OadG family protein n=2 Tax=Clostridium sp. CCUG 7971 TaxID=2811414 RepID=UPI001ABAA281|nr:OadG family protein [Clostridium sp. CCUG 7971]MBO3445873.1 OadG family protein [Clostridium sp. CCUG 7971]